MKSLILAAMFLGGGAWAAGVQINGNQILPSSAITISTLTVTGATGLTVTNGASAGSFSGAGTGLTGTGASFTAGKATALATAGTTAGSGYLCIGVDASGNCILAAVNSTAAGVSSSTQPWSAGAAYSALNGTNSGMTVGHVPATGVNAGALGTGVTISTANIVPGFNSANNLVQMTAGGIYPAASGANITSLAPANLSAGFIPTNVTVSTANISPGFNGVSELVQLNSSGYLPALNASLLTNLPSGTQGGATSASFVPYASGANVMANSKLSYDGSTSMTLAGSSLTVGGIVSATTFAGAGTSLTGTGASFTAGAVTNGVYQNGVATLSSATITGSAFSVGSTSTNVYVNSSGVGIGTTSPGATLDVEGTGLKVLGSTLSVASNGSISAPGQPGITLYQNYAQNVPATNANQFWSTQLSALAPQNFVWTVSTSSDQIKVLTAGIYAISYSGQFNGSGTMEVELQKNGSNFTPRVLSTTPQLSNGYSYILLTPIVQLNANDIITAYLQPTNNCTTTNSTLNWITIQKLW